MIPTSYLMLVLILLLLISVLALGLTIWSLRWPKCEIVISEKEAVKINIKGKTRYYARIKYHYFYNEMKYVSSRFSLLGSRLFLYESEIEDILISKEAYVCPLFPHISFVYFERRLVFSWIICIFSASLMLSYLCWL